MLVEKILVHPRVSLLVGSIVVVCAGALIWWNAVWQSPQRVFEDMLGNNLTAVSVTKHANAGNTSSGVDQYVRLQMGSTNATDWIISAKQANSSVSTESIGTPNTGYIRYTAIKTAQKDKNGKTFNFSSVLNVWGKSDGHTDTSLEQLFSQSVLDVSSAPLLPIGNLPDWQRQNILNYIQTQKILTPAYDKVKHETVNGRAVYTYQVSVALGPYVRMMQAFGHDLGVFSLDTVDANQYSTAPPLTLLISVDRTSHQLIRVSYPATGYSQSYADWGLLTPITIPNKTISVSELQKRIQNISTH